MDSQVDTVVETAQASAGATIVDKTVLTAEELLQLVKLNYNVQNVELRRNNIQLQLEVLNRDLQTMNKELETSNDSLQEVNNTIAKKYGVEGKFSVNPNTGKLSRVIEKAAF